MQQKNTSEVLKVVSHVNLFIYINYKIYLNTTFEFATLW